MPSPRLLLVEGPVDQRVITALVAKHGLALKSGTGYLVEIKDFGGVDSLLNPNVLRTVAQQSGLKSLGLVLDADDEPGSRLAQLQSACKQGLDIEVPAPLPPEGWILENGDGAIRIGLWMMPDNTSRGMLETFLAYLVPAEGDPVWTWTEELCDEARARNAPFREVHRDKARIHAYLAFQDEPGRQLHEALINRILDPEHEVALKFFSWFCRLFEVAPDQPQG